MSNKTQLQINNTSLEALITRVNAAKDTAASLPEAGGGGGSVETCTVSFLTSEYGGFPPMGFETVVYIGGAGQTHSEPFEQGSTVITVQKGSLIFIHAVSDAIYSLELTNASLIADWYETYAIQIHDNAVIAW